MFWNYHSSQRFGFVIQEAFPLRNTYMMWSYALSTIVISHADMARENVTFDSMYKKCQNLPADDKDIKKRAWTYSTFLKNDKLY